MIKINNAKNIEGNLINIEIPSEENQEINAEGLTLLPGLIDPHVHFRTPGMEYKEDWRTAALAAIYGGYTYVFDMPNVVPPTITSERLKEKKALINSQLKDANIPLRYELFFGADKNHFDQIEKIKNDVIGIKVFMGCSTGDLVIDDDESLHKIFKLGKDNDLLVAVHAEDEHILKSNKANFKGEMDYPAHSEIRSLDAARVAVKKAIDLSRQYGTKLYILHVTSIAELELIKAAKEEGLNVYAETTPHHLFLDTESYPELKGRAVINPPLRTKEHRETILNAIHDGTIDTIGSDHAPHKLSEKEQPYGSCPSGMPGIETTLPLLLNAYNDGLLSLQEIVNLTSKNAAKIFDLESYTDCVLVDLNKEQIIDEKNLKTKCAWSSFNGLTLKGAPVYTILNGRVFDLR